MALGFVVLGLRWPITEHGPSLVPLLALFAVLVMLAFIDYDTTLLPDVLTLPAVVLGLLGTLLYGPDSGLPNLTGAFLGGALGAGIIVMVNRIGGLILRRLADTRERLWPIGMDQVNVAALAGALGGWGWGIGAAAASLVLNLASGRTLRLAEPLVFGLWPAALLFSTTGLLVGPLRSLSGSLAAAGVVALLGAGYWWLRDLGQPEPQADQDTDEDQPEPVAMGFGDVKLAAILGVMLGWQNLLVALFLAFLSGAVIGLIGRALGGSRMIPFGPYLVIGGVLALFFGTTLLDWYLGMLGAA